MTLSEQDPSSSELDLGKVALGGLIDRLELSGFVMRQADPVDRRVKRVYLTKQALSFLKQVRRETDKFNARIVEGMDRAELAKTADTLLAMKRRLLSMSEEAPPAARSGRRQAA